MCAGTDVVVSRLNALEEFDRIIEDILTEAANIADYYHCFIEADVQSVDDLERSWSTNLAMRREVNFPGNAEDMGGTLSQK